jgi:alcohol dehydrogenase (cytochrome c)
LIERGYDEFTGRLEQILGRFVPSKLKGLTPDGGSPLPIKDKIVIGASGGDTGVHDWIAGLDAATGKLLWRKYTIPAPGEPGSETWKDKNNSWQTGGGAVWVTGTYDPDTNQTL